MKTRILSGAVLVLILAAVLSLGFLVSGCFIAVFVAFLAAAASRELLKNAFGVSSKAALLGAALYAGLGVLSLSAAVRGVFPFAAALSAYDIFLPLSIGYFLFAVALVLACHTAFSPAKLAAFAGLVPLYTFAFGCLTNVVEHESGLFYLLLLLNFSSICDTGAYFVGSAVGRHKLCVQISPKKTVEGAVGGVVFSLLVTVGIAFAFSAAEKLPVLLLCTVPFCVIGMMGDLFASVIKRAVGLKDYGNLIPGHGGILDRVDSILLIAPVFYWVITTGVFA